MFHNVKRILVYLRGSYQPDLRALSVMRIALALVVMADLLIRGGDLAAHYTNEGIWPTHLIKTFDGKPWAWSLHAINGSYGWALFLFCVHFVSAVFLLLGYKTRLANLVLWLLTISLHNRNIYVLQSGDDLLRLLLFWGLFLPWHSYYALDAKQEKKTYHAWAGFGYLMLVASVYFFTANLKSGDEWRTDGSAIYYALSLDQLRMPVFGELLYHHHGLMKLLTRAVYWTELILPVLILWPAKKGRLRLIAFVLILILHTAIGLTLYVGLFFLISIVAGLGLLPGSAINKLDRWWGKRAGAKSWVKQPAWQKMAINVVCSLVIALCLIINFSQFYWFSYELRKGLNWPVQVFRLDQYWGMFSPGILKTDGWFVYYGIDAEGRQWDMRLNNDYVDFSKPEHVVSMYKTDRWRKLAELMQSEYYTFLRPLYGKYVLRRWNHEHPEKKLVTLNLYFMEKENLPGYRTSEVKKKLFCVCNDD